MTKTDYKKEFKEFYSARVGKPSVVHVPQMNFIMVDGKGDPNTSQDYVDAIQALYPVAYTIKFTCKIMYGKDFGVMPLEGLWWAEDMANFRTENKNDWLWTAMIMQPEAVNEEIFYQAIEEVRKKKSPAALDKVKFASYDEGRAAQVMHVGPYSEEGATIRSLHEFIRAQNGALDSNNKHHHEIYLGNPRRTDPAKLKTIIRQPF